MKDPCVECDNLGDRNSFFRQHHVQLVEFLADPTAASPFSGLASDIPNLTDGGLKLVAETTFEGICIYEQGVILDANRQCCDLFGYASEELQGMDGLALFAPQSQKAVAQYFSTGFQGPYQAYGLRKYGGIFPVEVRARGFQQDGKVLQFAVFRDITERREMEKKNVEIEKKYQRLYDNYPSPLYRTRISDGQLLECNWAMVELFGYESKDEFCSAGGVSAHYVEQDGRAAFLSRLKKEERIEKFEIQFRCRDDHALWVEVTAEIFPEQFYLEGSMQNITAFKVLSKTERQVLRLIVQGRSNRDIACGSERSIRTIEDHRSNIMKKLGAGNLVELLKKAESLRPEF